MNENERRMEELHTESLMFAGVLADSGFRFEDKAAGFEIGEEGNECEEHGVIHEDGKQQGRAAEEGADEDGKHLE